MEEIYILDAVNYLFRSYYAIGPMNNDKGESTNALYGFIRSIKKVIKDFNPSYMIAVFDGPDNKKSRSAIYSEYKMNRKGAPEDLYPQITLAYEYCDKEGIPALTIPGIEADDTIATIAKWAEKKDFKVFILSSDKDLFQLINKQTKVINVSKNNLLIDSKKVEEIFGVKPDQILDYLSIMGDKSDNIPGLPGFGPKTASSLLQEYKTLDNIFENVDEIKGKKQETLKTEKKLAYLSKQLATLDTSVQIPTTKSFYALKETDVEQLTEFYHEMRFTRLLQDLHKEEPTQETATTPHETEDKNYTIITKENLEEIIKKLSKEKEIAIDVESTSLNPVSAMPVGIGLCAKSPNAFYIPLNGDIDEKDIIDILKPFLESKIEFYGHNIKYDYQVLKNIGLEINNICFDTILASYLITPHKRQHSLDKLSLEYFNKNKISIKELIGEGKKQISMKDVPIEKVGIYCCEDVDYTVKLKEKLDKEITKNKLTSVLYNIEIPLIKILAEMERNGIYVDEKKLENIGKDLKKNIQRLEKQIHKEVGKDFNINSPKQLSEILYKELGLTPPRKKTTEYATGAEILEKLKTQSPIVADIIEYRLTQKLLSTYVESLPKQINNTTHRIHPTFNQSITATGRLSCQDPNLQNIPVRSPEGKQIRSAFKPEKNQWSFLSADYSQIELRILAHFSEDPELVKAFKNNEDIHTHTASIVFKVPKDEVTKQQRHVAKAVNFGTVYGQGPYGLSQLLNIPFKEASSFIKTYFEKYKYISSFLEQCKKDAQKHKYAITLLGRKRPIPEIDNKSPVVRAAAERLAINTPLQGTAADIIKISMINIDEEIKKKNLSSMLILQIHDELIFEVPDNEIPTLEKLVKEHMEKVVKLKVPLVIDIEVGKNWAEC
jgi:DNA polymerase I